MSSKVSVIMPVFNRADMVGESIESVLAQSYTNWELIITDSNSEDESLKICLSYAEKDSRIKVYALENRGISVARNNCLDKAKGDYVLFVDSDDIIHPLFLETLVNAMERTGAKIGGSACQVIRSSSWSDAYEYIKRSEANETEFLTFEETVEAMFSYTSPINLVGGVMMSRELIGDTRFNPDLHIGEDFLFVYQNLIKGTDAIFFASSWYYARIHENNVSKDFSYAGFLSRFKRRVLVWQSEERFGRSRNVIRQKKDAFNVFKKAACKLSPTSPDGKRVRSTMKLYRKEILPALSFKYKLLYWVIAVFPKAHYRFAGAKKKSLP